MAKHKMLIPLEKNAELFAGDIACSKIMEGSEEITEKTDKRRIAEWVKTAMEKMDAIVNEETRVKIMENCGYNCATINKKVIERAKERRMKYNTIEEFIEAEERKPASGTRLVRKGQMLHYFYTPKAYSRPMRCYCSLLSALPKDETVSSTYCNCSKGFVKRYWERILDKPVQVQLARSAVAGSEECEFIIEY